MNIDTIKEEYIDDSTTEDSKLSEDSKVEVMSINNLLDLKEYFEKEKDYWLGQAKDWGHPFYASLALPAIKALNKLK